MREQMETRKPSLQASGVVVSLGTLEMRATGQPPILLLQSLRQLTTFNLKPTICNMSQDNLKYGSTRTKTRLPLRLLSLASTKEYWRLVLFVCMMKGLCWYYWIKESDKHWRLFPIWYSVFCMWPNNPRPGIPLPFSNWMFAGIRYIFYCQGDFSENINIKRNIILATVASWDSLLSSHDFMRNWVSGKKLLTMFSLKTCQTCAAIIFTIIH